MSKVAFDAVKYGTLAIGAYNQFRSRGNSTRSTIYSAGSNMSTGMQVSRVRRRTGRKKRRTGDQAFRAFQGCGSDIIYRWQQTSREYMGPGRVYIGLSSVDATYDRLPIHFMCLTTAPDAGSEVAAKGNFKNYSQCRIAYNKLTGAFQWAPEVNSVQYNGVIAANNQWQLETEPVALAENPKSVFHKWTDIKLNLYGTYTVPIHYTVTLCQLPEQLDPLATTPYTNMAEGSEVANMFKDWTRDLCHSTMGVNSGHTTWRKDVRIIKQYKCTIQPLSYSDQAAEAGLTTDYSSAPHIKELRWFIRHDRFRNYRWSRDATTVLENRDFNEQGWDQLYPSLAHCDVEWGKKVFLFIQASAPSRNSVDSLFNEGAQALVNARQFGSYDLMVRNSFTFHTS